MRVVPTFEVVHVDDEHRQQRAAGAVRRNSRANCPYKSPRFGRLDAPPIPAFGPCCSGTQPQSAETGTTPHRFTQVAHTRASASVGRMVAPPARGGIRCEGPARESQNRRPWGPPRVAARRVAPCGPNGLGLLADPAAGRDRVPHPGQHACATTRALWLAAHSTVWSRRRVARRQARRLPPTFAFATCFRSRARPHSSPL